MPVIWMVDAYRAGERAQVRALVDALAEDLGWEQRTIALSYRDKVWWPHALGRASLAGITAESRRLLQPPWPDLVVSSGVRNEPVCRWLRRRSRGHTRYVHVGRPWGPLNSFDLVVTTPQYRVPHHPRVLHNRFTLHSVTPARLDAAAARFEGMVAHLPRPRIAVAVGGDSGPYTLGPRAATRLGQEASALARACGGSLLVTTSARTRAAAADALQRSIDAPHVFHRWQEGDAGNPPNSSNPSNPYWGFLALADRLIVTADSIAMLSEACATGKAVQMFDLGGMRCGVAIPDETEGEGGVDGGGRDFRLTGWLYGFMQRRMWKRLSRDLSRAHAALRWEDAATWLGDLPPGPAAPGQRADLPATVARVRALLDV